jgi:predicted Fe-Mo cluster-binding NifX family protein
VILAVFPVNAVKNRFGDAGVMMPPDIRSARIERFPRTVIPVFLGRVSPVLDTCTRLCLVETGRRKGVRRKSMPVRGNSLIERAEEIGKLGAGVVICGAVGNPLYTLLKERDIDVICGITGEIGEVIKAYRTGTLGQPRFRMPGAE